MEIEKKSPRLRLFVLLVMMLLALAAAACGEEATDTGTGASPTADDQAAGDQTPEFSTIEPGILKVGSCLDYRPFEYFEKGEDEPTGFDVEISDEIAARLGLEVQWIKANFDTIFTALAAGKFDMVAAASTITEERLNVVDFSDPYYNARQSLSINAEQTPDIASTDDLGDGDVVGVQKGTTGKTWAEENLAAQGVDIKTYDVISDAFTALEGGNLTGVINDEPSSIAEVEGRPGLELVQAIDTDEHYGLALSKENPELTQAVNMALADLIADGTYERIFTKYFPELPLPEEFQPSA